VLSIARAVRTATTVPTAPVEVSAATCWVSLSLFFTKLDCFF
jgi:hypothetical protein